MRFQSAVRFRAIPRHKSSVSAFAMCRIPVHIVVMDNTIPAVPESRLRPAGWIRLAAQGEDEYVSRPTSGPLRIDLVNQRSGEHKSVKVGFSWGLFFFAGTLGIPLFMRRLYVWGAVFLVLWILYIFGPVVLPDTAHYAGTYLSLCLIGLALQVWMAVKGNEMTAKNLLENGWSFSKPNARVTRYAMTKWNLSHGRASESRDSQTGPPVVKSPSQVSNPRPEISEPIVSATVHNAGSPVRAVAEPIPPVTIPNSPSATEYHQRFWESKFDVYLRLCRAAGILAFVPPGSGEYAIAYKDLITIGTGEFQLVASPDVSAALKAFVDHLQTRSGDQIGTLKSESQKLALACRQDMGVEFHLTDKEEQRMVEDVSKGFDPTA